MVRATIPARSMWSMSCCEFRVSFQWVIRLGRENVLHGAGMPPHELLASFEPCATCLGGLLRSGARGCRSTTADRSTFS